MVRAATDAVTAIARVEGFMLSSDVLKNAQPLLSAKELEGVPGGLRCGWTTGFGHI